MTSPPLPHRMLPSKLASPVRTGREDWTVREVRRSGSRFSRDHRGPATSSPTLRREGEPTGATASTPDTVSSQDRRLPESDVFGHWRPRFAVTSVAVCSVEPRAVACVRRLSNRSHLSPASTGP